jgi:hypothetical protein
MSAIDKYTDSLLLHIDSVREYGRTLGIDEKQLQMHDMSKWSKAEFEPYAYTFSGDDAGPHYRFYEAWLHHIHHNPHHWQHWIFSDGYSPPGSNIEYGVMPMPERYAMEMIADWHGAGYAYQNSWDIQPWLSENASRILVHSKTNLLLTDILTELGYSDFKFKSRIDAQRDFS